MSYTPRAPQSRRLFRSGPLTKPGVVLGFVEYSKLFLLFTVVITIAAIPHPFGWPILIGHWYLIWFQQTRAYRMTLTGQTADTPKSAPVQVPSGQGVWMNGTKRPKLDVEYPLPQAKKVAHAIYRPDATPDTTALASAGWYPDPSGGPVKRWWDGQKWTDEIAAL